MLMFTLAVSCFTSVNLPWFMDLTFQVPVQYCLYSIRLYFHHQSHLQLGFVSLWLHPFILSGVISPLFSSSILGTYRPGEFIFQYHIFFSFSYCSWGSQGKNIEVVCYSLLQWTMFCQNSPPWPITFAAPCVATWLAPHSMAHSFTELQSAVILVIILVRFLSLWLSFWRPWDYNCCFYCLPSDGWV